MHIPEARFAAAKEEYLLTGTLEPTNEAYTIAKILGIKAVEAYRCQHGVSWISAMPTNLYGQERQLRPGDQPCAARIHPTRPYGEVIGAASVTA